MSIRAQRIVLIAILNCLDPAACQAQEIFAAGDVRSEVEQLEAEFNTLTEIVVRQEQLLADAREISQELPLRLQTLHSMTSRLETRQRIAVELKNWATASLVLGNQRTPTAAALKETPGGYQIVAIANHPFLQYAVAAAIQGGIPCRGDAAGTQLLEQVISETNDSVPLPVMASGKLNAGISAIVALRPVAEPGPQFMVFHDPVSGDQKVAVVESSTEGKSVRTIDKAMEQLAESAYTGGSVWIGRQDEIEPHIEIGDPFVDYCALAIQHALTREEFQRKNICLSIGVKLDASLVNTSSETPTRRANRYLGSESQTEGILAVGRNLHDEFYKRLIRQGIPVLERENEAAIKNEDLRPSLGESAPHITKATHSVILEVDKTADGLDRVSVRLVDVTSSHSIWAANDSRTLLPNRNWKNYILHTGVPSIAEFHSDAVKGRVLKHFASESYVTVRPPKKLVLIDEGRDGQYVRLRSPFGIQAIKVPWQDVTLTAIVSAPGQRVQSDNENSTGKQSLHYAAWRLGSI